MRQSLGEREIQKVNKINSANAKGFSLVELMIVIVIIGIALSTIAFNVRGAISMMNIESVTSEIVMELHTSKLAATSGNAPIELRTFDLNHINKNHPGVSITTALTTEQSRAQNNCGVICENETNQLCVSGNTFCFTPQQSFVFERASGKLTNNHVIFIKSDKRTLAILINQAGNHYVAEFIGNTWKTRRDLQDLFPANGIAKTNSSNTLPGGK